MNNNAVTLLIVTAYITCAISAIVDDRPWLETWPGRVILATLLALIWVSL